MPAIVEARESGMRCVDSGYAPSIRAAGRGIWGVAHTAGMVLCKLSSCSADPSHRLHQVRRRIPGVPPRGQSRKIWSGFYTCLAPRWSRRAGGGSVASACCGSSLARFRTGQHGRREWQGEGRKGMGCVREGMSQSARAGGSGLAQTNDATPHVLWRSSPSLPPPSNSTLFNRYTPIYSFHGPHSWIRCASCAGSYLPAGSKLFWSRSGLV